MVSMMARLRPIRWDIIQSPSPGRNVAARVVVLVSGSGTNLQALLDAGADPG
jgi:hypothetical protein